MVIPKESETERLYDEHHDAAVDYRGDDLFEERKVSVKSKSFVTYIITDNGTHFTDYIIIFTFFTDFILLDLDLGPDVDILIAHFCESPRPICSSWHYTH